MTDLLDRKFATLSGGEKQKAALACIFLLQQGDGVILLDEPFANIDAYWAERIAADLKAMNQEHGMTIIAVDHSLDHWLERADSLIVMDGESHVLDPIPMAEVRGREQLFRREGLRWPYEQVRRHREILTASETEETGAKAQPSVRLRDVCIYAGRKKFRDEPRKVINHSDASFYAGQITALLGPSGAGKTTLFRTLLGKQKYTGIIEKREEVGIVFQNPSNQFITQNVLQEVETGILGKYVKAENLSGSETEKRAIDLLKEFHLGRYRRYSPYMLSQGEQRRLAVLAVLAGKRRILLLDEPTYGQDDAMTGEIMAMLAAKMREENLTIVISTHDARLVEEWADSVYEIRGGKLIWRS
jgi:energy-coupling factor transport system ATP-binding protein